MLPQKQMKNRRLRSIPIPLSSSKTPSNLRREYIKNSLFRGFDTFISKCENADQD